jgi:hypothetical protein
MRQAGFNEARAGVPDLIEPVTLYPILGAELAVLPMNHDQGLPVQAEARVGREIRRSRLTINGECLPALPNLREPAERSTDAEQTIAAAR